MSQFHIYSESTIVSEGFKGGTRGDPIMSRDAVSRTANVERNGGHESVNVFIPRRRGDAGEDAQDSGLPALGRGHRSPGVRHDGLRQVRQAAAVAPRLPGIACVARN